MLTRSITQSAMERLKATPYGLEIFQHSTEVIVFGSMSVGLERSNSDIDILCISNQELRIKTPRLDLIILPQKATESLRWLGSELASHIAEYGKWIKGVSGWKGDVKLSPLAIERKHRRIEAFMRALPGSWSLLNRGFRSKYATKLRRETQRLLLMERGAPIPPTKVLDSFWDDVSQSPFEVQDRLREFVRFPESAFANELIDRIKAALPTTTGSIPHSDLCHCPWMSGQKKDLPSLTI